MEDKKPGYVEKVKINILRDILNNNEVYGKDYRNEIGFILSYYLANASNKSALILPGIFGTNSLENLMNNKGKNIFLDGTLKCGILINKLSEEYNQKGLRELEMYANKLMRGVEVIKTNNLRNQYKTL